MGTAIYRNFAIVYILIIEFCLHIGGSNPAIWSEWNQDFTCTVTCGNGYAERSRQCSSGNPRDCSGAPWEVFQCDMPKCNLAKFTTHDIPSRTLESSTTPRSDTTAPSFYNVSTQPVPNHTSVVSLKHYRITTKILMYTDVGLSSTSTTSRTTIPVGHTISPVPTMCAQCIGSMDECEILYYPMSCNPPNNYCINRIVNKNDGSRFVNRTCGDFNTCFYEWYRGSSDVELCQKYDEGSIVTMDFQCTYCCVHDNCNISLKPKQEDLYMDK